MKGKVIQAYNNKLIGLTLFGSNPKAKLYAKIAHAVKNTACNKMTISLTLRKIRHIGINIKYSNAIKKFATKQTI